MELTMRNEVDLIDGRENVDVDVQATVSGRYISAKIAADPDDSWDAEYPDLDLDAVLAADTQENVTHLLTDLSKKNVMASLWHEVWDWDDYDQDHEADDDLYDDLNLD